jgi:hypothetical protein
LRSGLKKLISDKEKLQHQLDKFEGWLVELERFAAEYRWDEKPTSLEEAWHRAQTLRERTESHEPLVETGFNGGQAKEDPEMKPRVEDYSQRYYSLLRRFRVESGGAWAEAESARKAEELLDRLGEECANWDRRMGRRIFWKFFWE